MSNRIVSAEVTTTRFDPAQCELRVVVVPEQPAADLELRGRLTGPRCLYSETVEIAYPLRPLPSEAGLLRARTVIEEASLWEPQTPFLYEGVLELWQAGVLIDRTHLAHGVRQLVLGRHGLRLNGQPFVVRGVMRDNCAEVEAFRLRQTGVNLLLVSVRPDAAELWGLADRFGFFVLGRIDPEDDQALWLAADTLSRHTSCLGWLLPQGALAVPQRWHNAMALLHGQRKEILIGLAVDDLPLGVLPGHVAFLACPETLLSELGKLTIPRIVLSRRTASDLAGRQPSARTILGWICRDIATEPDM
jgi:hypothetical protein